MINKYVVLAIIIIGAITTGLLYYAYQSVEQPGGPEATGTTTTTARNPGYITVVDDLNRTVKIKAYPQRIVSTMRIVTSFLLQFDVKNKLVGADSVLVDSEFYTKMFPWLKNTTVVSTGKRNVNLEQVLALSPDVVFAKSYQRSLLEPIESQVPVVYLDMETPEMFLHDVELVGRILGQEDRARELCVYYAAVLGNITVRISGLSEDEKPYALFIYYRGDDSYNVPPTHWMQSSMLKIAGARTYEVAGTGWSEISVEQIIALNPEVVFITAYHGMNPVEAVEAFKNNTAFSELKAVVDNRVYPVPSDDEPWDMPTPKWIICTLYMAVKLHPELFSDINITEAAIDFYMKVYSVDRATAEELLPTLLKE